MLLKRISLTTAAVFAASYFCWYQNKEHEIMAAVEGSREKVSIKTIVNSTTTMDPARGTDGDPATALHSQDNRENENTATVPFKASSLAAVRGKANQKNDSADPNILATASTPDDDFPTLSSLVSIDPSTNTSTIIGNVQFLLDFAIIGHPKTSTSALVHWLSKDDQIRMKNGEDHALTKGRTGQMVQNLYQLEHGRQYKRGYKSPADINSAKALQALAQYWPQTKLIVGVRHPVNWFESWYNYFSRRRGEGFLPPAETMVGNKLPKRARFHCNLALLGKTALKNKEQRLLGPYFSPVRVLETLSNPVMLYDVRQPFDANATRKDQFRLDLSHYIGLARPLHEIPAAVRTTAQDSRNYHYAIDICDSKFDALRAELVELGQAASEWIQNYFVKLPDVTVSSPEHFIEGLQTWGTDPCERQEQVDESSSSPVNQARVATDSESAVSSSSESEAKADEAASSSTSVTFALEEDNRPPLTSLIRTDNVIGNVEFLLDFAIVGHPKCATTSMMRWLTNHDEVAMFEREIRFLRDGKPAEMVKRLYELPVGEQLKRGYKAPNDIRTPVALQALGTYWPKAGLIVGVRHPVKWFQSWYNFKKSHGLQLPPAETFGGKLPPQVFFHSHLSLLGKTNISNPEEANLLGNFSPFASAPISNKVFLYDISQVSDDDKMRNYTFRRDLSHFLGLQRILDPMIEGLSNRSHDTLDICNYKYSQLRSELVNIGDMAATWIQTYFLDHADVKVSSRDYFESVLDTWRFDPCAPDNATSAIVAQVTDNRPPLSSLIDENERITADVQWLLDFAIVGFPKTGTSTIMRWLAKHEEVQMYEMEIHSLEKRNPPELVRYLYDLPPGSNYKRGFKDPCVAQSHYARDALQRYWPKTKLVVGLRHPVKWFESWYNFKASQGKKKAPALEMLDDKKFPVQVMYHHHLSAMGKTNHMADPDQMKLLGQLHMRREIPPMPNEIFIYDISQPFDRNQSRAETFRRDFSKFIGLNRALEAPKVRATSRHEHAAIAICEEQYQPLRAKLMQVAVNASTWIIDYFLPHPDVTVSSPDHFKAMLETWLVDPCQEVEQS